MLMISDLNESTEYNLGEMLIQMKTKAGYCKA